MQLGASQAAQGAVSGALAVAKYGGAAAFFGAVLGFAMGHRADEQEDRRQRTEQRIAQIKARAAEIFDELKAGTLTLAECKRRADAAFEALSKEARAWNEAVPLGWMRIKMDDAASIATSLVSMTGPLIDYWIEWESYELGAEAFRSTTAGAAQEAGALLHQFAPWAKFLPAALALAFLALKS